MNMGSSAPPAFFNTHHLRSRTKAVLRKLIPAHRRFVRAGEYFLVAGEREVHQLSTLVVPGSIAIDVGAHIGDYTYSLCRAVGAKGQVIAVEPLPDLARTLERAVKKLGLPVTVLNCALSAQAGEAQLWVPTEDGEQQLGFATLVPRITGGDVLCVEMRGLDDICAPVSGKISFIKIDVEGHELDVIRGGEATIRQHRPNLLVEIEQRHSPIPIAQTFDHILSFGYRGEFLEEDSSYQPLSSFSVETHQTARLGKRSYISNFIFRPL